VEDQGNVELDPSAAANKHLTPCTLELGGKSPTYIDDSGDMEVTGEGSSPRFTKL
jgi:aldehyde dehydrogenase (NAD+)